MKKRSLRWRRVLCAAVSAVLLTVATLGDVPARADTQGEINALREQLRELEADAQAQQEVINALTRDRARAVDRKVALDAKIELTLRQIQLLNSQMALYEDMVGSVEKELQAAQELEDTQAAALRTRMRAMEESGNHSYISFIFDSESIPELLARLADVSDIMHYDRVLEEEYMAARREVEAVMKSYAQAQAQQEELIRELDSRQEELDAQVQAAEALISGISEQSENAQAEYDAIEQARAQADAEIDALLQRLAAEEAARKAAEEAARRAAAGNGGGGNGGGGGGGGSAVSLSSLSWPCPGCNIVTSRFGARTSPTAGASSYHGGLDIGAGAGSSIVASAPGNVVLASYNGGYGNCVMINHGNGIVTLYGHMQSCAVGVGQYVSQGQVIGYVGSTGVATGPHLHFEVRVNGAQTDPAPYFSGLTYYC